MTFSGALLNIYFGEKFEETENNNDEGEIDGRKYS